VGARPLRFDEMIRFYRLPGSTFFDVTDQRDKNVPAEPGSKVDR
jgi:hypothetical protein